MNILKKLLASTVIALSLMAPVAYAAEECVSSDQVWQRNLAGPVGGDLDHVNLKGQDAEKVFNYLNDKFNGTATAFDEVTFIAKKGDDKSPVLMVIFKDGCMKKSGLIHPNEFMELVGAVAGQTSPKKTADPEVINPEKGI